MTAPIVEFAPFRLKDGVSRETLLEASARIQERFLNLQDGFVRRDLVSQPDGSFADIVLWSDKKKAEAAMAGAMECEACAGYFALMDWDPASGEPMITMMGHLAAYGK